MKIQCQAGAQPLPSDFLHAEASPNYYMGINEKSWSKGDFNSSRAEDCPSRF